MYKSDKKCRCAKMQRSFLCSVKRIKNTTKYRLWILSLSRQWRTIRLPSGVSSMKVSSCNLFLVHRLSQVECDWTKISVADTSKYFLNIVGNHFFLFCSRESDFFVLEAKTCAFTGERYLGGANMWHSLQQKQPVKSSSISKRFGGTFRSVLRLLFLFDTT